MISPKKESIKRHHIGKLSRLCLSKNCILISKLEYLELIFYETTVLVTFVDSVVELIYRDRLPWLLWKFALLSAAYCHELNNRDEVL